MRVERGVPCWRGWWGWAVDRVSPDRYDVAGRLVCLVGVSVIMYWPRW